MLHSTVIAAASPPSPVPRIALTEDLELLGHRTRLAVEIVHGAREALEFLGDLVAKLVHARTVVAAHRGAEVIAPDINRCEMECVFALGIH
jgi:hypothetical protein